MNALLSFSNGGILKHMKEYEEFYEIFPDSYAEKEYRKIVGAYLQHMCLKYCKEVLTSGITSIYYRDFIELVYYALSKKRKKSIQLIRKIIATCPNKELRYKILDTLMDYYKDNTDTMVLIQQEYIRILKSQ